MSRCAPDGKIFYGSNFHGEANAPERLRRTVLHCDANSFYASCEAMVHPEYNQGPFAVCGSVEDRHGIVLAKNDAAKRYGIQTGETVWMAKRKCPHLLTVRPTFGLYTEISKRMNGIFADYTDLIEPFGIDESWLDVTGSSRLFGDGREIAESIRSRVKKEIGITVSVGVSFNKSLAKLGSDLKKPDAVTVIPYETFREKIWPLPVGVLLFAGPSSEARLNAIGVRTVGDLAMSDPGLINGYLGKNGMMLREFALGQDGAPVTPAGWEPEPKSVSNGMTFRRNLVTGADISFAVNYLACSVAERLRRHGKVCNTVAVSMRRADLTVISRRVPLAAPTCLWSDIASASLNIICANNTPDGELYSVAVHAEDLKNPTECELQQSLFPTSQSRRYEKRLLLEKAFDGVRNRYGKSAITIASAIGNDLLGG